jgi:hypothetical protein
MMRDLVARAPDSAQVAGVAFAEVRIEEREIQSISVKNGVVDSLIDDGVGAICVPALPIGRSRFSSATRF